MPGEIWRDVPSTTATGASGTTAPAAGTSETWTVSSSAGFPPASSTTGTQFHIGDPAATSEIITVTNVSGTTWTVTRGAGTNAQVVAHAAGATYVPIIVSGFLASMLQFVPTAVKTAAYTAQPGDFVPFSTASGNLNITLPNAPADGTTVGAKMVAQAAANVGTITAAGSDVFNVAGGPTTYLLAKLNQGALLRYSAAGTIWYVYADPVPPALIGTITLTAGGVGTVSTSLVTAVSSIFATSQVDGGTPGWLRISSRIAGTSFVIKSSSATDASTVAYFMY